MKGYSNEIESQMKSFYASLSEKDRRRYAGIEAAKLGYGGIQYIRRLFACDAETIKRGMAELNDLSGLNSARVRRPGGGRKSAFEIIPGLDEAFLRVMRPPRAEAAPPATKGRRVQWTSLSRPQISNLLEQEEGIKVSVTVVDQLLAKHNYRQRKASKSKPKSNNSLMVII